MAACHVRAELMHDAEWYGRVDSSEFVGDRSFNLSIMHFRFERERLRRRRLFA